MEKNICQLLHAAVYGTLKKAWRKTLTYWKKKAKVLYPKQSFLA